ncbi:MAG: ATP-binding protein [Vicinamibacterales bacterium]
MVNTERFVIRGLAALAVGGWTAMSTPAAGGAETLPRIEVLLLLPDQPVTPAIQDVVEGVRSALAHHARPFRISTQHLDVTRFAEESDYQQLADWLAVRYVKQRVDVVVAIGQGASNFTVRHAAGVWPAPAAVLVIEDFRVLPKAGPDRRTAFVPIKFDLLQTARTALSLVPGTRQIVLLGGATPNDLRLVEHAQTVLAPLAGRVAIIKVAGLPLEEIKQRAARLPKDSLVLALAFYADGTGRTFVPQRDAIAQIAAIANRPIFTIHDNWVGTSGVVGGRVFNYKALGRRSGERVLDVLGLRASGSSSQDSTADSSWQFDWRQLRRWNIDERALPAGSVILHREPTVWQRYQWTILGIAVALSFQMLIIGALLVQRNARKRAEMRVQKQLHELARLNLTALAGEIFSSVAHELSQPLTAVLGNAQALQRQVGPDGTFPAQATEILDDIATQSMKMTAVIHRIHRLLRKEPLDWSPVDVNSIAVETTELVRNRAALSDVVMSVELAPDLPPVSGDHLELQQVVLNLVMNAMDAAGGNGSGSRPSIGVTTERAGDHIQLSVRDSGPGISAELQTHLFEPFFTTKKNGLGMGLSISRSIVELHGGRIVVHNLSGGGTEFRVTLPAAKAA